jgi:hypothetical protein
MRITSASLFFLASSYAPEQVKVQGFTLQRHFTSTTRRHNQHNILPTELYGRKKGNLGKKVSLGGVTTTTKKKKGGKKSNKTSASADDGPAKISNSLSQWAATLDSSTDESTRTADSISSVTATRSPSVGSVVSDGTGSSASMSKGASFERFQAEEDDGTDDTPTSQSNAKSRSKSSRRERSTKRQQNDKQITAQIDNLLSEITALVTSNNLPVPVLLQQIQSLTQLASPLTLKTIFNSSAKDYKLAWVGSDDAICHVGTGLHKVPLARLQEIFLTVGRDVNSGKSKTVRLMEVISILGPFPNVRNTLQGEVVNQKTQESAKKEDPLRKDSIRIMYDSMMDGLGKEIGAGTDDNLRYVDLDVVFADARALVCVVPSDGDGDTNSDGVFSEDGKNVLLFLKEDDLNYRLEELRAA